MPHFCSACAKPRKTVLCISDEPIALEMRKLLLEWRGYTVLTAGTRAETLEALARRHVDVVIADYYLSETTGDTVAADIRLIAPHLPVIVYSGASDIPISWATAVVSKPASPEHLFQVIEQVVAA